VVVPGSLMFAIKTSLLSALLLGRLSLIEQLNIGSDLSVTKVMTIIALNLVPMC
jgi:hypothetical protein